MEGIGHDETECLCYPDVAATGNRFAEGSL